MLFDVVAFYPVVRFLQREDRHNKSRRAEAALGSMAVRHRLLRRMKLAVFLKVFRRQQLLAVKLADKRDTAVCRVVAQLIAFDAAQDYGAGPAIPGGAAFFACAPVFRSPQPVEHGGVRIDIGKGFHRLIKQEADHAATSSAPRCQTRLPSTHVCQILRSSPSIISTNNFS